MDGGGWWLKFGEGVAKGRAPVGDFLTTAYSPRQLRLGTYSTTYARTSTLEKNWLECVYLSCWATTIRGSVLRPGESLESAAQLYRHIDVYFRLPAECEHI